MWLSKDCCFDSALQQLTVFIKKTNKFTHFQCSRYCKPGLARLGLFTEINSLCGDVAQLVEYFHGMEGVLGSNPCISTTQKSKK